MRKVWLLVMAVVLLTAASFSQDVFSGNATALQGVGISGTLPTNGQALCYNSSTTLWTPGSCAGGGSGFTAGNDLSGTSTSQTVIGINNTLLSGLGNGLYYFTAGVPAVATSSQLPAPGAANDLICSNGTNFIACSTGVAYYTSSTLSVPALNITGTTPASISWVTGTGNIPPLCPSSTCAGFAAPTTGGTSWLWKWIGTGPSVASVPTMAAVATGDNVNESAMGLVPYATTKTNSAFVESDSSGGLAGWNVAYSTPVTGLSMSTSPTTLLGSSPYTMVASPANGQSFTFSVQVAETTKGTSGTCTTGNISVYLCYEDYDQQVSYGSGGTACSAAASVAPMTMSFTSSNWAAVGATTPTFTTTSPVAGNNTHSIPIDITVASGTAITYSIEQTTASNCTTPPVVAVRPLLVYKHY